MKQVLLLLLVLGFVQADMYMHTLRGSNNRLDEANRERNNANRLFDSQNNNRGGYNVGKMNLFEGESVPISWTNQHGCNNDGMKGCDIIIQAMCDPLMRDGTVTDRIPDNPANCRNFNCDLDVKYGRHESYDYYQNCKQRERNKGLFTASQNLGSDQATRTRQNPGGTRYGYECPEERDYYPYWGPTPWADLAVFTSQPDKCDEYIAQSENTVGRNYCSVPDIILDNFGGNDRIPITKDDCQALEYQNGNGNVTNANWVSASANGWPELECMPSEATRANHLGLVGHSKQWTYQWTVPEIVAKMAETADSDEVGCAFRFRYNITEDYELSESESTLTPGAMTAQYNSDQPANAADTPSTWPMWEKFGLTKDDVQASLDGNGNDAEADSREYVLTNNPQVDVFGLIDGGNNDDFRVKLQLAVNTAQYGRTFQDRSHMTFVRERPADIEAGATMKLVTVAGKRGNIVQTFPGHEYFFWPEKVHVKQNEYLHFAWSGSNTNPNNNDGQGKEGTDRSNLVPMKADNYQNANTGLGTTTAGTGDNIGALGNSYPAFVSRPDSYELPTISQCRTPDNVAPLLAGFSEDAVRSLATGRRANSARLDNGNMEELDDASASFEMEPMRAKSIGCWAMVSTRNNNFSNRSQKSTICVDVGEFEVVDIGTNGGEVVTETGWLDVPSGAFTTLTEVTFQTWDDDEAVSAVVYVTPVDLNMNPGEEIEFGVNYEHRALKTPRLMHRASENSDWVQLESEFIYMGDTTVCVASISEGGYYQVMDDPNGGAVAAIVIAGLFFLCTGSFMLWYKMAPADVPKEDYQMQA